MKVTVLDRLEGTTYRRKFWNETKEFGFYCFLCGVIVALMIVIALFG